MARLPNLLVLLAIVVMTTMAFISIAADTAAAAPPQGGNKGQKNRGGTGWEEHFEDGNLGSRWMIEDWQDPARKFSAPGYIPFNHVGYYLAEHVSVADGYLRLRLTQDYGTVDNSSGVISQGALIYTQDTYGYGTYEWRMRMSSTADIPAGSGSPTTGSVSAGFIYVNNSETEIDFEFSGHSLEDDSLDDETLYMVNWNNKNSRTGPGESDNTVSVVPVPWLNTAFKTYKLVWEKRSVTYYVDDDLQAKHTTNVPRASAHFMINHWGTNSPWWGGLATTATPRYFFVDWVKYTPLQ
ncbi:MAG: glycoside hydrolase family 16 protein [Acidobacteria bacterium]|nr:glycoside hydrolase family 16 protein [Acidobacteriota bacterium]